MLIALTGLSGAGKTTAVTHLENRGVGVGYYAGSIVREEIRTRGLDQTPDNERIIRQELRASFGMAVFAERALPRLRERCRGGLVLLDAIYCIEEMDLYRAELRDGLILIAVTASLATRSARLAARPDRPMTEDKLASRDRYEIATLKLDQVIASADRRLQNESGLDEFKQALDAFALHLT